MDQIAPKLRPKVSINIATYNRGHFLPMAIESILKQSFTNWEIIIVDDGSTDNTAQVIEKYLIDPRIHYFKNDQNLGICATRNRALQESAGEYLAVLDSHDFWADSDKLKKQVEFLDQEAGQVAIGTGVIVSNKDGQELRR
ncbi:MAG: glycosyltransferase family 2 protein, partial [Candidatus Paceibacterota bacterium]